jgi:gliotoxin/aspirochlorine biosynthesis gamma-glutamylcyclotransferase
VSDGSCWYFAYGSNMGRATFRERRQMRPRAARRAYLDHHRLCFDLPVGPGERAVANLTLETGARTWGVIYSLSVEACALLDRTEGVGRGLYRRISIEVVTDDGARVAAFAYQGEARDPRRKPSARYLGLLLAGARELALPADYVVWLEAFPLAIDEREAVGEAARGAIKEA